MPRPYRYLSDMPDKARAALERCHQDTILTTELDKHKIAKTTISALIGRGLLAEGRTNKLRLVYKPTEDGLRLLLTDEPRLLAKAADAIYTNEPGRAMYPDAGEAIDEQSQRFQTADAHDRMQGLPGRRRDLLQREVTQLTRRLKQEARHCDASSTDVIAQLDRIRTEIDRLEGLRAA